MNTISLSGISPSKIIRSEHILRIIKALNGTSSNDIIISGSLNVLGTTTFSTLEGNFTGSFSGDGSGLTNIIGEWDGTLEGDGEITGSLSLTQTLNLKPIDLTSITPNLGTIAVSELDLLPYYFNGEEWISLIN
jgi:hypothetical protein